MKTAADMMLGARTLARLVLQTPLYTDNADVKHATDAILANEMELSATGAPIVLERARAGLEFALAQADVIRAHPETSPTRLALRAVHNALLIARMTPDAPGITIPFSEAKVLAVFMERMTTSGDTLDASTKLGELVAGVERAADDRRQRTVDAQNAAVVDEAVSR